MSLVVQRIEMARRDENPYVIARMNSGWAVLGDVQPLDGYCLLLADPPVSDLNALASKSRANFLADMAMLGDAILKVTGCKRVNYEILGNLEPYLHAHLIPRYPNEPDELRKQPAMKAYDWSIARKSAPLDDDLRLIRSLRIALNESDTN